MRMKRCSTLATSVAALSLSLAGPAAAQTEQNGLVNVAVTDVTVQVPVGIAANLCDINANVLAGQLRGGGANCDADANSDAVYMPGGDDEQVEQDGLVNVLVDDVVIQLPVAIAANVCDANVNVLARQLRAGGAQCTADADSGAQA